MAEFGPSFIQYCNEQRKVGINKSLSLREMLVFVLKMLGGSSGRAQKLLSAGLKGWLGVCSLLLGFVTTSILFQ